jgi:hypothetical protein
MSNASERFLRLQTPEETASNREKQNQRQTTNCTREVLRPSNSPTQTLRTNKKGDDTKKMQVEEIQVLKEEIEQELENLKK